MKRFFCICSILLSASAVFAQRQYFVYLQTENDQPFFVRMGDKTYNSTTAGYLVLPGMKDSAYRVMLGFPGGKWPEQSFGIDIRSTDHGYLVKNFAEKGWGLFDMQSMAVLMATNSGMVKTETREVSAFTEVLSKAANDPSLKEKPVAVQEVKTPAPEAVKEQAVVTASKPVVPAGDSSTQAIAKNETVTAKEASIPVKGEPVSDTVAQKVAGKEKEVLAQPVNAAPAGDTVAFAGEKAANEVKEPVVNVVEKKADAAQERIPDLIEKKEEALPVIPEYKRSVITKRFGSSSSEGLGLLFVDESPSGERDTIRIVIPYPKEAPASKEAVKETTTNKEPAKDRKFLDISSNAKESSPKIGDPVVTKPVINTARSADKSKATVDCPATATESDFLKLRKKMVAAGDDDGMTAEAGKLVRTKCVSTEQVKNLGSLYLNDGGRYRFYDAVYPHITDIENFPDLGATLKDEYYLARFKAMLR